MRYGIAPPSFLLPFRATEKSRLLLLFLTLLQTYSYVEVPGFLCRVSVKSVPTRAAPLLMRGKCNVTSVYIVSTTVQVL